MPKSQVQVNRALGHFSQVARQYNVRNEVTGSALFPSPESNPPLPRRQRLGPLPRRIERRSLADIRRRVVPRKLKPLVPWRHPPGRNPLHRRRMLKDQRRPRVYRPVHHPLSRSARPQRTRKSGARQSGEEPRAACPSCLEHVRFPPSPRGSTELCHALNPAQKPISKNKNWAPANRALSEAIRENPVRISLLQQADQRSVFALPLLIGMRAVCERTAPENVISRGCSPAMFVFTFK